MALVCRLNGPLGSQANYAAFEVHWDKELKKKGDRREQPSLILALWNTFGTPILMSGFFKLITDGSQFLGPAIMQVRAPGSTAGHRESSKEWACVNCHLP
jgi:hypothetical protein